jgi:molecular chaperone GrpE
MSDQDELTQSVPDPSSDEGDSTQHLQNKIEELTNKWMRTAADFENYKKRKEAEGPEMMQFAKEVTVAKLMPSLQNLEQVLKYAPDDEKYKDWLTGLRGTIAQLEKDMEELGLKKIKTVGDQFDPAMHEAVEEVDGEAGRVIKEIQPGFMLNNKVIIPAKVVVGKSG